jgi:hypothetical protein
MNAIGPNKSDEDTNVSHFSEYKTLYIGLVFIFVGLVFVILANPQLFWQKLLSGFVVEVGFAFAIAWVVGATIERRAKHEHNLRVEKQASVLRGEFQDRERNLSQRLSQNVFAYLYSVNFPRSAFKVMEDYIFSQKVIKKRQYLEYEICDPVDSSGWIVMRCHFDYKLVNLSDEMIEHPVRFHASKVSGLDHPKVDGLGLISMFIRDVQIDPSKFPAMDQAAPDVIEGQQKFEEKISISPGEEVRVRVTFKQLKRVNDNDLYQSNAICESLELKLRYNPKVFNAFVEAVHPSEKFTINQFDQGDNYRIVTIEEPLLPKNGVFMWWNVRQEEGVAERQHVNQA